MQNDPNRTTDDAADRPVTESSGAGYGDQGPAGQGAEGKVPDQPIHDEAAAGQDAGGSGLDDGDPRSE